MAHPDQLPTGRVLLGATGLAIVLVALHAASHPLLRGPALASPSTWAAWAARAGAIGVFMSTLRLLAIGLCWYVVGIVALRIAEVATGDHRLAAAVTMLTGPRGHHALVALVGTGLVATTVSSTSALPARAASLELDPDLAGPNCGPPHPPHVGSAGATWHAQEPAHATPRLRATGPDVGARPRLAPIDPEPPPQLRPLPRDRASGAGPAIPTTDTSNDPDGVRPRTRRDAAAGPEWWTVRPGDHFWRIAEEHLERTTTTPPDEAAVRRHWRRLVRVNRGELVDADEPDLLLPGQVLRLPPVRSDGQAAPVAGART